MNIDVKFMALLTTVLCLIWSASAWAEEDASACVELGALAYDDWTSADGGGSGMLAYLRQDGKL